MNTIIRDIKPSVEAVLRFSQNLDKTDGVDKILTQWYQAKKRYISEWKGSLIYDAGFVEFELSLEEKEKRLNELIDSIEYQYDNPSLAFFIDNVRKDFFDNQLSESFLCPYTHITVPKGMKIIKAFKYFEDNEDLLHEFQTIASMILQENKISGNLFLSVHPLDFLSSSENTHKWRSCHALDGDYRAGNLSYMLDKSTIIAYLAKKDELVQLPNFPESVPWNSKKWRMLLFFEEEHEAIMAGRQYPFFSKQGLNLVKTSLLKDAPLWSGWQKDYITDFPRENSLRGFEILQSRHVCLGGQIYSMDDLVIDAPGSMHFNDLKYSSFYIPWYSYFKYPKNEYRKLQFIIGKKAPCVCCGKNAIRLEATMLCGECEGIRGIDEDEYYAYCDCCNRRVLREQLQMLTGNGDMVCHDCYETRATCDCCGLDYYSTEINYSRELDLKQCYWCAKTNENKEEKKNG